MSDYVHAFPTIDAELPRPVHVPLSELTFCVVDLETTGLDPEVDEIVELACVRTNARGEINEEYSTLIRPERMPAAGEALGASEIHGITAADVADAPSFAAVAPELQRMLAGSVMVAHNSGFERRFLNVALKRLTGHFFSVPHMCTMFLAGGFVSLGNLCSELGVELDNAHRALDDARATAEVLAHHLSRLEADVLANARNRDIWAEVTLGEIHRHCDWGFMGNSWRRPFLAAPDSELVLAA